MGPFAAGDHKAGFVRHDDCLGPLGEIELAEDMSHVRLDRAHTDHQLGGDVDVRQAFGEQAKGVEPRPAQVVPGCGLLTGRFDAS